jgi:pyrrolidone-carboxylate peptidase
MRTDPTGLAADKYCPEVLISYFAPFGGRPVNASRAIAMQAANRAQGEFTRMNLLLDVETVEVAVTFAGPFRVLSSEQALARRRGTLIMFWLALGEDLNLQNNQIRVEDVAQNFVSDRNYRGPIIPGLPAQVQPTTLETTAFDNSLLQNQNVTIRPAGPNTAGDFICNEMLFLLVQAHDRASEGLNARPGDILNSLFVHVAGTQPATAQIGDALADAVFAAETVGVFPGAGIA